jgi:hypothetical protein
LKEVQNGPTEGRSLVFILAQPPATAGSFGWSSRGVAELCHWAVFVCRRSVKLEELKEVIAHLNSGSGGWRPSETHLGFLVQVLRQGNGNISSTTSTKTGHAFDPFTAADLMHYFPNCSMTFVGTTTECNSCIKERGKSSLDESLTFPQVGRFSRVGPITNWHSIIARTGPAPLPRISPAKASV